MTRLQATRLMLGAALLSAVGFVRSAEAGGFIGKVVSGGKSIRGAVSGKYKSITRGNVRRYVPRKVSGSGLSDAFRKSHPRVRIDVRGQKRKYDAARRKFYRKAKRAGYRKPSANKAAAERQRWKLRALKERDNGMRFLNKTNGNQGNGSSGGARGEGRRGETRVGEYGASLRGRRSKYRRSVRYRPTNTRTRTVFPRYQNNRRPYRFGSPTTIRRSFSSPLRRIRRR